MKARVKLKISHHHKIIMAIEKTMSVPMELYRAGALSTRISLYNGREVWLPLSVGAFDAVDSEIILTSEKTIDLESIYPEGDIEFKAGLLESAGWSVDMDMLAAKKVMHSSPAFLHFLVVHCVAGIAVILVGLAQLSGIALNWEGEGLISFLTSFWEKFNWSAFNTVSAFLIAIIYLAGLHSWYARKKENKSS